MAYYNKSKDKTYRDLVKDIDSGALPPVVLLHGEEVFLIDWAVKRIKEKYVNEATSIMDYAVIDQDAEPESIMRDITTLSVFSEKRVVWLKDTPLLTSAKPKSYPLDILDSVKDYIDSPIENTVVILSSPEVDGRSAIVKGLRSSGAAYELNRLDDHSIKAFIAKRLHDSGLKIGNNEMDFLIHETGYNNRESDYDLYSLDNDLKKISACVESGYVDSSVIEYAILGDKDTFIFDLIDGISGNNKRNAFEILDNRLERDRYEAMSIVGAIVSQLEIMLMAKEYMGRGMNAHSISMETGINEYRLKKAIRYASRYDLQKLKDMLISIYDVNKNVVNGSMDPKIALQLYISRI